MMKTTLHTASNGGCVTSLRAAVVYAFAGLSMLVLSGCGPAEPDVDGTSPDMRRLTDEQYDNIISDLFGPDIEVGGLTDPLIRTDGLLAVGARTARITPAGLEQYYVMAKSVASQVTDAEHRHVLVGCAPADVTAPDDVCAEEYFKRIGRLLFRRPLRDTELDAFVQTAREMAETSGDFYSGIELGLAGMLVTPQFLFVIDETEPDPDNPGDVRLTPYAKATRLSFFLWNTTPNQKLLDAAENGDLDRADSLAQIVDEMILSPRFNGGLRAFFKDYLGLAQFETVEKDSVIYNAFSNVVAQDAQEELLRMISDLVIDRDGDFRDIFTTRKTFLTGPLARIYRVRVERPDGPWVEHEFGPDENRAGILSTIGFNAMTSHPGRSSPTLRGKAIRESLLCQRVPDPPGDVDFALFEDPDSPNKTARQRLDVHSSEPACAGCHKITDPIGLGLENFDGIGQFRTTENGADINVSGELDGVPFSDPVSLGQAMHDNPVILSCVVWRLWSYAKGRAPERVSDPFIQYLAESFERDQYRLVSLIRRIASSEAFYAVIPPTGEDGESRSLTTASIQEN